VRFLGRIEDVSGLLAAVDVAVLSSRSEGMPNAVLEPMAAGLPVVATDIEGVREAVGPTGVAVLAPPGDHRALANALDRALTDEALRSDARAINPASIAERFGSAPAVDAHANVVGDAIAQGRRSQGFDTPAR
jgi:glycosyltransferase involved in cell wall biosynthesis